MQKAVFKIGSRHLDMVGNLETALESPRRNALVQHLHGGLFGGAGGHFLQPANRQRVFTRFDHQFGFRETGHRDRNAIGVFAQALDIIGRVGRSGLDARRLVEQRKQTVKADCGTVQR